MGLFSTSKRRKVGNSTITERTNKRTGTYSISVSQKGGGTRTTTTTSSNKGGKTTTKKTKLW
jgi:hypothetical protein